MAIIDASLSLTASVVRLAGRVESTEVSTDDAESDGHTARLIDV